MPPSRLTARSRLAAAMCLLLPLALAGCSGGEDSGSPQSQETAAGATLKARWPLTGLPLAGPAPEHPVTVVKIDNTAASAPQVGLGDADLVAEELVEGGATRLAAFFHSTLPRRVGPVRSFRATDIGVVRPVDAVLVGSGAAPVTRRRIDDAGIETVTEGGRGFARDSGRSAPYNLFVDLAALSRTLESRGAPDSYVTWGSPEDLPRGRRAAGVAASFSAGHTTTWRFQRGRYVEEGSYAAEGDRFEPATLVVLQVRVGDAGYRDPAGNPVPETRFAGRGPAMVFHDGRVVSARWRKDAVDTQLRIEVGNQDLELPPGKLWLGLVPADGGGVSVSR